ncbi:hypothetical protein FIBSPDRAFT_851022 [Athelia psychrophila]|uniref:Uncharacterized protein n=1 Tax=Athelia psychrophila TaxID=1759441 RepID=A0A166SUS3_9AGAM|nr:hypothetical protein FIBSPDRAFT_851022 [Fibularhizoctonia sp. CBS 109695]
MSDVDRVRQACTHVTRVSYTASGLHPPAPASSRRDAASGSSEEQYDEQRDSASSSVGYSDSQGQQAQQWRGQQTRTRTAGYVPGCGRLVQDGGVLQAAQIERAQAQPSRTRCRRRLGSAFSIAKDMGVHAAQPLRNRTPSFTMRSQHISLLHDVEPQVRVVLRSAIEINRDQP